MTTRNTPTGSNNDGRAADARGGHTEIALRYDAFGRLVLTDPDGAEHVGVTPVRAFPFTADAEWISFCDERGHEVFCLASLCELRPSARAALEADLARREFIPAIERILHISRGAEPTLWRVVTDRGETTFKLPTEDHIRRMGDGALITDAHGIRYRIVETRSLDAESQRLLKRYL